MLVPHKLHRQIRKLQVSVAQIVFFFYVSDLGDDPLGDDPFEDDLLGVGVTNIELAEFLSGLSSAPSGGDPSSTSGNSRPSVKLILRLTLSSG